MLRESKVRGGTIGSIHSPNRLFLTESWEPSDAVMQPLGQRDETGAVQFRND